MLKNSIEVSIVRIEGVKHTDNLSCHVYLKRKLYDVMAPLTPNNKENKVILPSNISVTFEIKSLDKPSKPLYSVTLLSNLFKNSFEWLPLFLTDKEISELKKEIIGPKLFLKIKNNSEESFTAESDVQDTSKDHELLEDIKYKYELELEKKQIEINNLKRELETLKNNNINPLEPCNKNIDTVEIFLMIYLKKNKLEGLFTKYKGSVYKYGSNFTEISIKDNKLACRTDMVWTDIEDFIMTFCRQEVEVLFDKANRSVTPIKNTSFVSAAPSPIRFSRKSVENLDPKGPVIKKNKRSESFQKLLKPTSSTLSKTYRPVAKPRNKSPFKP
jgi:hypothetical protein